MGVAPACSCPVAPCCGVETVLAVAMVWSSRSLPRRRHGEHVALDEPAGRSEAHCREEPDVPDGLALRPDPAGATIGDQCRLSVAEVLAVGIPEQGIRSADDLGVHRAHEERLRPATQVLVVLHLHRHHALWRIGSLPVALWSQVIGFRHRPPDRRVLPARFGPVQQAGGSTAAESSSQLSHPHLDP